MMWGDYNSSKAQLISVVFRMCEGEDYCESREAIQAWLKRKFIVLLYNQKRFDTRKFHSASVIEESKIEYIPINTQVREIIPFRINRVHIELQDYNQINLGDFTLF